MAAENENNRNTLTFLKLVEKIKEEPRTYFQSAGFKTTAERVCAVYASAGSGEVWIPFNASLFFSGGKNL
jgi:hypothetical protein